MRHSFLISLLLIAICGFSPYGAADLFAQDIASRDTVQGNKYNLSQFWHETVGFCIQPTKWDGGDWLRLGVMGGATFLTMQVDQPIRDAVIRDNRRYFYSVPIEGARMYGELYPISRVYQDMHWTSDNVLGGAIGFFIATWVVDVHERNDSRVHVSSIFPLTISVTLN